MAKRIADDQITRERFNEDDQGEGENPKIEKASAAVMAKRKILQPKGRKMNNTEPAGQNKFSFGANVSSGGMFQGFGGVQKNGKNDDQSSTVDVSIDDKTQRIRALNERFLETVKERVAPNSIVDLTPIAQKYIDYYRNIGNTKVEDATKEPIKSTAIEASVAAESDNSSDSEDEIKVEGPKFIMEKKPAKGNLPFTFNKKPVKKADSDSDSDSEVEIKGPTFTFNKDVKETVFKFDPKKNSSFNFATGSSTTGDTESSNKKLTSGNEGEKQSPNSIEQPQAPAKTPFSSGSATNGESKPSNVSPFSFTGKQENEKLTTNPPTLNASERAPPVFKFGSSTFTQEKPSSIPANTDQGSKFTFGSTENDSKSDKTKESSDLFKNESTDDKNSSKPLFSFNNTSTSKPMTSFGAFGNSSTSQSGFSLSSSGNNQEGNKADQKPAFSFGSTSGTPNNDSKPVFQFTSQSSTDKKTTTPAFTFGANNSTFNNSSGGLFSSVGSDESKNNETNKPKFQFSFKKPEEGNGDIFKAQSNGDSVSAHSEKPENSDTVVDEDTGGNFAPVAKLSGNAEAPKTGEENEETLYSNRSKLMFFDPSNSDEPYSNRGLGDLKVLKSKTDQKTRILIRADGGLRVLFNTLISKDLTYSKLGNGSMIRVPTVDPTTKSIQTYVVKVKTPNDGQELLNLINKARES